MSSRGGEMPEGAVAGNGDGGGAAAENKTKNNGIVWS